MITKESPYHPSLTWSLILGAIALALFAIIFQVKMDRVGHGLPFFLHKEFSKSNKCTRYFLDAYEKVPDGQGDNSEAS